MTVVAHTTPYLWPYDRVLEPPSTALVVCGAGAGWASRTPLDVGVEGRITNLRTWAHSVGIAVILLDQRTPLVRGLAELPVRSCAPLLAQRSELIIEAVGTDGFYGSALDATLRRNDIARLLLSGRGFETSVHSTLRRANDIGYECLTVADACAPIDPTNAAASVSSIEMSGGIFGAVGLTNHVCASIPSPVPRQSEPDTPPKET